MKNPKIITFKIYQEEFYFLGIENLLTENVEAFWSNFFEKGVVMICLLVGIGFTITGKQQGSFANDENGKPITFTGCSFGCKL